MRALLFSTLLLVCACMSPLPRPQAAAASSQLSEDEQMLLRLERELANALLEGNATFWDRHLAPTFSFVSPGGYLLDATGATAGLRSGEQKWQSWEIHNPRVQVYGNAAVVTFENTQRGGEPGLDISGRFVWTDTFIREGGRWRLVARQGTPIQSR